MKEKVQSFGRFLSAMVMPNLGAFIAWGLVTTLFIPKGFFPNEVMASVVDPMIKYLLPMLIGYTAGKNVAGARGGVMGAIATIGVIVGADIPMFLGAMIVGPFAAWVIKKFDKLVDGHIPAGFEMLVNNFSIGILGAILAEIALIGVGPLVEMMTAVLAKGVGVLVSTGLLPLTSLIIEPAKVLFLNNAINHGILTPLGLEGVIKAGSSIFFLLEANPGPGLGILLAYCVAGKGAAKSSAPGAALIHFFGGIHEIYFPYILMNPVLLISAIVSGASGIFVFSMFKAGLTAPAAPGSILAILAMSKGSVPGVLAGVLVATVVSFAISVPILKIFGKEEDLEAAKAAVQDMKSESKGNLVVEELAAGLVDKIVFACDAGMGSSAMGATVLRKKLAAAGLDGIEVVHAPVSEIPADAKIVVTHVELRERAAHSNPTAKLVLITNFMAAPEYDILVNELKG